MHIRLEDVFVQLRLKPNPVGQIRRDPIAERELQGVHPPWALVDHAEALVLVHGLGAGNNVDPVAERQGEMNVVESV